MKEVWLTKVNRKKIFWRDLQETMTFGHAGLYLRKKKTPVYNY